MHILDKIYFAEKYCKRASARYREWRDHRPHGQFLSHNKQMQNVVWQIIEMVAILSVLRPEQSANYSKVARLLLDDLREQPPPSPPGVPCPAPPTGGPGHDFLCMRIKRRSRQSPKELPASEVRAADHAATAAEDSRSGSYMTTRFRPARFAA